MFTLQVMKLKLSKLSEIINRENIAGKRMWLITMNIPHQVPITYRQMRKKERALRLSRPNSNTRKKVFSNKSMVKI